ncbi:hypothetical protein FB45DRAFT_1025204 [Roridomyces roridus]|uniref:UCH repeated domain-containing protein n=1 Tax=Roridomyces roridus TaxID=1738132 RepID=A0AAD7C2F0_9AGAR|nr:hypothetical protein FB45DRAFT_1025204 [Roridomyces roridus]
MSSAGFREPELVPDTYDTDGMPELIGPDPYPWPGSTETWGGGGGWGGAADGWGVQSSCKIDGRDTQEEENWWDPGRQLDRPGPGILPPLLAYNLHDPGHTLFSVSFTPPDIKPNPKSDPSESSTASSVSEPPSFDDVRTSVPHPDAYYCPKDNGWVILSWGDADTPPALARSSPHCPLPRPMGRQSENCVDGTVNETHHFHKYEKAVDSHQLPVPFRFDQWDTMETVKHRRRVSTVLPDELNLNKMGVGEEDKMDVDEPEGPLLDLYVCCQCNFYLLRSPVIPGVIPKPAWDDLLKEKNENPQPGKTPASSTAMAMETLLMAIENLLWKRENRMLRVTRSGFQNKIGWSPAVQKVFQALGFTDDMFGSEAGMRPPSVDASTPQGKQYRAKLLRAWAEIGSWTSEFERLNPTVIDHEHKGYKLWVHLDNAREKYQLAIGAHPTQIPRADLDGDKRALLETRDQQWQSLGMTPTTYSPDMLEFAYLAQCRCDPRRTVDYFSDLRTLADALQSSGEDCVQFVQLLDREESRGRFSHADAEMAARNLGFGADNVLARNYESGNNSQKTADDALKIIAALRGSRALHKIWDNRNSMNPDQAYSMCQVSKDVDEEMLITLEEEPLRIDQWREAFKVIAFFRGSERLQKFLEIGHDPGVIVEPTRLDLPRGLNQLGNTCYVRMFRLPTQSRLGLSNNRMKKQQQKEATWLALKKRESERAAIRACHLAANPEEREPLDSQDRTLLDYYSIAVGCENRNMDRYADVMPYDRTRVVVADRGVQVLAAQLSSPVHA